MNRSSQRATLFLTELVIGLFVFIVCAAVCVGLLVRAYGMSRESAALTESVYIAQTAAEQVRAGEDPALFYRADGTETDEADAAYFVVLTELAQSEGMLLPALRVDVFSAERRDAPSYSLTVKCVGEVMAP